MESCLACSCPMSCVSSSAPLLSWLRKDVSSPAPGATSCRAWCAPCVVWLLNGHQAQHTAPSSTTSALGSTLTFQPWTVAVEEPSPDKHPQKLWRMVHLNFCPCKEMCCLQETQLTKEKKRPYCTIFTSRIWAGIWSIKSILKKSYRKLYSPIGSVHHQLLVKVLPGEASGL